MKDDRSHHPVLSSEKIATLLTRYRASGLALKDFARGQGLPPGRLHYWLYQKYRSASPGRSPGRSRPAPAPVFQEVKLTTGAPLPANWGAEVSLPRGLVVRFPAAAEPGWMGAVVQALQEPC